MASNFYIFAPEYTADATAYRLACDALWSEITNTPNEQWYPPGYLDVNGYTVVAKLAGGPFIFAGDIVEETPAMAALRANGLEVVDWVRPPEE